MATHWTRFQDEEERAKNVYEQIDAVMSTMNGHEACGHSDEEENVEWLCELLKALTGVTSDGSYDPDVATVGRNAARRWLRGVGYVT